MHEDKTDTLEKRKRRKKGFSPQLVSVVTNAESKCFRKDKALKTLYNQNCVVCVFNMFLKDFLDD